METPSSTRRITRSQASAPLNNIPTSRKKEESEKIISRQRNGKPDQSALVDITNDSPIVGLAMGRFETPSSFVKKKDQPKPTPGSGEALLRGQVKTLLQKVEEEAELSKLSFEHRMFLHVQGIVDSPSKLLAPTPANTPHVPNLSCNGETKINPDGLVSVTPSKVDEEPKITQAVMDTDETMKESIESQKSLITRLLFDSSEKSEISECDYREKSMEDDDASVWSIQVNASTQGEDEEDEEAEDYYKEEEEEEEYEEDNEEEGEDSLVDELCEGLSKIIVQEKRIPEFKGKHTRFVYNSDDEIEGEEEIDAISPGILRLKGLPTPKGKHIHFPEEADD